MRHSGRRGQYRRGATAVEMAVVGPIALLLVLGLIVAALGVFRFQQVCRLAQEGARWASIRGEEWEDLTHSRPITSEDVYRQAILPLAGGLNTSYLTSEVNWNEERTLVHVTVRYRWLPEAFLSGSTITATTARPVLF